MNDNFIFCKCFGFNLNKVEAEITPNFKIGYSFFCTAIQVRNYIKLKGF